MAQTSWFLPDYIEDQLPAEAAAVESLRRVLLDWFGRHGYLLIAPPMVEHMETLLAGVGGELDSRTFKFTDSLSGRTLGVRADITPQTSRVAAHLSGGQGAVRLCYCGPALHSVPAHPWSSRELMQIGAELHGCAGPGADWECVDLACSSLRQVGVEGLRVGIGHAAILDLAVPGIDDGMMRRAREALVRRDLAPLRRGNGGPAPSGLADALSALIEASLADDPVAELRRGLGGGAAAAMEVAEALGRLADSVRAGGHAEAEVDFCLPAGHGYHTGMVFDVCARRRRLVRGGRYGGARARDGGRRPAVGFSMDLKQLAGAASPPAPESQGDGAVAARVPDRPDPGWAQAVNAIRDGGGRIRFLHDEADGDGCQSRLVRKEGKWSVEPARGAGKGGA